MSTMQLISVITRIWKTQYSLLCDAQVLTNCWLCYHSSSVLYALMVPLELSEALLLEKSLELFVKVSVVLILSIAVVQNQHASVCTLYYPYERLRIMFKSLSLADAFCFLHLKMTFFVPLWTAHHGADQSHAGHGGLLWSFNRWSRSRLLDCDLYFVYLNKKLCSLDILSGQVLVCFVCITLSIRTLDIAQKKCVLQLGWSTAPGSLVWSWVWSFLCSSSVHVDFLCILHFHPTYFENTYLECKSLLTYQKCIFSPDLWLNILWQNYTHCRFL